MKSKYKVGIAVLFTLALCILAAIYLNSIDMAVMNPKGIIGVKERSLLVISSWLMLIVVIPVFVLTFYIIWKYRAGNKNAKYSPDWEHNHLIEAIWWGIPTLIIIVISVMTWIGTHELDPFKPLESDKKPLTIQVVALQWKWLFIYPEQGIASVNYFEFPENTPIHFDITSDAPMNSFWIPQLGGQIFAMSGMKTQLHLNAHEKGTFRGCSANISGKGFAGMEFFAKSTSEAEFESWTGEAQHSSNALTMDSYNELAKPSENNPVALYSLQKQDLFERIIMKYMDGK